MLALSRKVGTFLKIGDALIQIVAIRREGRQARIAIFAPRDMRVQRFDEEGNYKTHGVRIIDMQTHDSAPDFVAEGYVKVTLACGHVMELHAGPLPEKVLCSRCDAEAAQVTAQIQTILSQFSDLVEKEG